MSRNIFAWSAAGVVALGVSIAAQQYPPASNPAQPDTRKPAAAQSPMTATVEGCLVREQDVPGRKPNVAEKAGVMEDYILTNAKVVKGSAPRPSAAAQAKPGEPTGTAGSTGQPMYDVKGLSDEKLKQHVGKRVQIEGTFADVERSPSAAPNEDLVDLQATAIRPASGDCPAK